MNVMKKIAVTASALLWSVSAQAGLWMTGDNGDLYFVATQVSAPTFIGNTGIANSQALTLDSNGTIYVTDENSLYTVDRTTGASTSVGSFGGVTGIQGLAFDVTGTILYGANASGLFSINTGTGSASFLGALDPARSFDDLAVAHTDVFNSSGVLITAGTLVGLDATHGIYAINTTTFASTLIEAFAATVGDEALTIDSSPEPGVFTHNFNREAGGTAGGIYSLDLDGGVADQLILTTATGITGMFLENDGQIPLPGTAWLFGSMLAGLMFRLKVGAK